MSERETRTRTPVEEDGLIFACRLDGKGSATLIGWAEVEAWKPGDAPIWIHLDQSSQRVRAWLQDQAGLTLPTATALLADETRPRIFRGKRGLVTILRGVNLNAEADTYDMIAMRMWSEGQRVITIRRERLMTPRAVLETLLEHGTGPRTISELYERLISAINERITPTIALLEDQLDVLEAELDLSRAAEQRRALAELRPRAVNLRRYIAPQREAIGDLMADMPDWMDDAAKVHLRESNDRLTRFIEELDAVRERALVLKDDIANQLAEATNKTLYALAIISGIFLPLAFLTGLLGINIGGMPGVDDARAFWVFCGMIVALLIFEIWIFRKLRWL